MNRKIEDFKLNTKKKLKTPTEDVYFKKLENHNIYKPDYSTQNDSSKYDFLEKRTKKSPVERERIHRTPQLTNKNNNFNKKILFLFVLSVFIGVFYLLSTVFLRVNITIVSKSESFDLKDFKLSAGNLKISDIPFELMILSDKEYKDVVLTNSKEVSEKAKGKIVLYNEYSTKPQNIIAGSFVSDEKGKTYKTDKTVSIPGYTIDDLKKINPGQIDVDVTAFLPGETYNGNPEFFTVNAFKNTDKYKKIYGKAKSQIEGGMVGLVYLMSEEEKMNIENKTISIKEKLLRNLSAQVPDGYVLYPDATNFYYKIPEGSFSKTPESKIEIDVTLSAFLLKQNDLSNILINKLLPNIKEKERSEILNPNLLDSLT
jgi:hypothetical protein